MQFSKDTVEAQILAALADRHNGLRCLNYFTTGSTARVFHVEMDVGTRLDIKVGRIVKVFRHDGELARMLKPEDIFLNEVRTLTGAVHTNLINLYSADYLSLKGANKLPYYIMEYLPGAEDLDRWIGQQPVITSDTIVDLLLQAIEGLKALHDLQLIHCDIKAGNLLVGNGGRLKVADLGFSKVIRGGPERTGFFTTFKSIPKKFTHYLRHLDDPRQAFVDIPREELDESFDLHCFSCVVRELLAVPRIREAFDVADRRSLEAVADRLDLDKDTVLPKYRAASEVLSDLRKLQRLYLNRAGVKELSSYTGTRTIRIPVSGSLAFSDRVQAVVSHPLFLRLHNALQLGLTYYVFPGAHHTRFEHSLGVFGNVTRYINSLLSDDYQPYFRQLVDEEKIATTMVAGLVHDIGQHSFAHSLEDVSLAEPHEKVADRFITGTDLEALVHPSFLDQGPLQGVIAAAWPEVNIDRLRWMITGKREAGMPLDIGWDIMRSIINGPVDADKTDYLLRDAHHAGVEYARSIDIFRFMNSLTASVISEGKSKIKKGVLAITWKGQQPAENIILARTQMFWVLYWHHAVRSAHAMVAHACHEHLQQSDSKGQSDFYKTLYCGTLGELLAHLLASSSSRASALARLLLLRRLFKRCISLDFMDNPPLYSDLLKLKAQCEGEKDFLLKRVATKVAEAANKLLGEKKLRARLKEEDFIVDIPKEAKDRLGEIYIVERNSEVPKQYESRGLAGSYQDWQNRVRTVRVFVDPSVEGEVRTILRENGGALLASISGG